MLVAQTLRDYFQPEAVDRISTKVDKLTSYVRTGQRVEKFLAEFGILRRKAERHMFPAGGVSRPLHLLPVHSSCAS